MKKKQADILYLIVYGIQKVTVICGKLNTCLSK